MGVREDLRYAWRALAAAPGVAVAAILSLALGIGANSAIFSVASPLLLSPLPYADPDRLVILWNRSPGLGIAEDWFSTAQYFDIRGTGAFADVALAIGGNDNLTGGGEPERIGTIRVSSNLLPMLGVRPALGRLFTADEDRAGAAGTALLAHGTWLRRYGGDPSAVGRSLIVNGVAYRIVGVLPAGFTLPRDVLPTLGGAEQAELLLPLPLGPDAPTIRTREDYNILARLPPGVTAAAAQARMDALTARLRREHPADLSAERSADVRRRAAARAGRRRGPPSAVDPGRRRRPRPARRLRQRRAPPARPRHRPRAARWRSAPPSAPAPPGWCGSSSPSRSCSPAPAGWPACWSPRPACRVSTRSAAAACRASMRSASMAACWPSPPSCRSRPGCCSGSRPRGGCRAST